MEIAEIEAIPVEIGIRPETEDGGIAPYVSNFGASESAKRVLIRLQTTDDIVGWGEFWPELSPEAAVNLLNSELKSKVIGRTISHIGQFLEEFQYYYFDISPLIGAIEMAMWDAWGRTKGMPIYELLGGKQKESVEFCYLMGITDEATAREHARFASSGGYSVIKTKGGKAWEDDVQRIIDMYNEIDGATEFRIDPNQGWKLVDAVRAIRKLEDRGIFLQYLEQPFPVNSEESFASLRQRVSTPVGINEDSYISKNLTRFVRSGAIDVAVVDFIPMGGLLHTKKLVHIASDAGISVSHHSSFDLGVKTAAVLHLVGSSNSFDLPSDTVYYAMEDDIISEPFEIVDGCVSVPDEPGLGIEIDREKVERYRIKL